MQRYKNVHKPREYNAYEDSRKMILEITITIIVVPGTD